MTHSRKKERCTGQRDKTGKMVTSLKIRNFPLRVYPEKHRVHQMRECQICASPPSHLSWCIFSESHSVWLLGESCCGLCVSNKNSGLHLLQYPSSQAISPLSLLGCEQKSRKKKSLKIISFYSPHHWLQLFSNRFYPANTVRVCQWWYVMIGQSVVGCFSVVRICVWPVVI